jgi:2-keto-3-deoxy-L-rhamnonate aldolase RhmA
MQFLTKIKEGKRVYGTCITSFNPLWPKVWKGVGLDFVFIDTEHISLDRTQVSHLCQQIAALEIFPILRIPKPDPFLACQGIDAGAKGIVAPYLENPQQILELVGATKFRPLKGKKLARILAGEELVAADLQAYLDSYNSGNWCIANIESVAALDKLDDLLAITGLDAVFIGPHDLSVSMGLPEQYDHPDFEAAVLRIIRSCRSRNLSVGIHFSEAPARQIRWMKEGVNLVIHSSDFALFYQRLQNDMQELKSAFGDSPEPGDDSQSI